MRLFYGIGGCEKASFPMRSTFHLTENLKDLLTQAPKFLTNMAWIIALKLRWLNLRALLPQQVAWGTERRRPLEPDLLEAAVGPILSRPHVAGEGGQ